MTESQPAGGPAATPTDRTPPPAPRSGAEPATGSATVPDPAGPASWPDHDAVAGAGRPDGGALGPGGPVESVDLDPSATPPEGLWDRMRADPQYAPEHLALEAVRRLGPEARVWAERARANHPDLPPEGIAEIVVRKFVTRARLSGAISGAAGLPGAVLDMGVLAWTQARMVLHLAAVYGHDPAHPDRATDLLVLQRVHKVAQTARLALGVAAGRERAGSLLGRSGTPLAKTMMRLGFKLAQMAGVRAAKRLFAKAVPGAAIILGTWANSSATKDLAGRSRELYRQRAIAPPPAPMASTPPPTEPRG